MIAVATMPPNARCRGRAIEGLRMLRTRFSLIRPQLSSGVMRSEVVPFGGAECEVITYRNGAPGGDIKIVVQALPPGSRRGVLSKDAKQIAKLTPLPRAG